MKLQKSISKRLGSVARLGLLLITILTLAGLLVLGIRFLIPASGPEQATRSITINTPYAFPTIALTPTGQTLALTSDLPSPVLAFASDPYDPRGMYALLASYELFYTNDRGLTWFELPFPQAGTGLDFPPRGESYPLAQPDLVAVAFRPGLMFARAGNILYRTGDAGQDWQILLESVALFTVNEDGSELYAWRPELPQAERGLYRSQDGGDTWFPVYHGFFPPELQGEENRPPLEGILSLVIDPAWGRGIFAGTHFGIFRSFTGGATWMEFNSGLPSSTDGTYHVHIILPELYAITETATTSGARLVLARFFHGEIRPDQDHWEEIGQIDLSVLTNPLDPGLHGVFDLVVHEDNLFLATSNGLLVSRDRGEHWELLPDVDGAVYRLGFNFESPELLYAWMDSGMRLVVVPTPSIVIPPRPSLPPITGGVDLRLSGSAGGSFKGFVIMDNIAVLGMGLRLEAIDLTTPGAPRTLGRSGLLPGVPESLAAVDRYVYTAIPDHGLLVFDLSAPSQPVELSKVELPFAPRELMRQGNYLFVLGGLCLEGECKGGVAILDITDPILPRLLGVLETQAQTVRMELAGKTAYLFEQACKGYDCTYSLRVVDVSDPAAPEELAVLETPGPLVNLIIDGERLLLAYERGLLVFDVSQPDYPQQIGRLQFNYLNSFAFYDQVAYAVSGTFYVQLVDLSDPARPRLDATLVGTGSTLTEGQVPVVGPRDAIIYKRSLYILGTEGEFGYCWTGLHVFDLSDPDAPRQINTEQETLWFTCAGKPVVYEDWLVLADWKGIHFVDLAEPERPRLHGSHPLAWTYGDLAVQDGYVYASNGLASDSLLVVDANEPAEPVLHGPFPFSWAWGVAPAGQYLYIPTWGAGLAVADLRDPTRPEGVAGLGEEQLGGPAYRVALDGDRLVVVFGEDGMIRLVDATNPKNPLPLGSLDVRVGDRYIGADWIAMHEGFIYLITDLPKGSESAKPYLVVVDARDPLKLVQVNQLDLPDGFGPAAMHFHEGRLLLAGNLCPGESFGCSGRFSIYDLTDPVEPVEISALEFPFELKAMAEEEGVAYLSAAPDRVLVLDISEPDSPALAALVQVPGCAGNLAAEGQRLYVAACEAGLLIMGVER